MKTDISPGLSKTLHCVVRNEDSARFYGSGLLEVFATPAMISFMERTSMELVQDYLPEGYGTVGTRIEVSHIKASKVGASLDCRATLIDYENRRLRFEVAVHEEGEVVGSGIHERYIIEEEKFLQKLEE